MNFTLRFGALSPPLDEQLRDQGISFNLSPLERSMIQRDSDEITRLNCRGILSEKETKSARARIFKIIQKNSTNDNL